MKEIPVLELVTLTSSVRPGTKVQFWGNSFLSRFFTNSRAGLKASAGLPPPEGGLFPVALGSVYTDETNPVTERKRTS